jgi:hypothetical protein
MIQDIDKKQTFLPTLPATEKIHSGGASSYYGLSKPPNCTLFF